MSKETEEKQPPMRAGDPRATKKEVEMKETAFGVSRDKDGNWMTVEVSYDPLSGQAKVSKTHLNESKGSAVERFKILVGQSNILD